MDQTIARLIQSRPELPDIMQVPAVKAIAGKLDALRRRQEDLAAEVRQVLAQAPRQGVSDAQALLDDLDDDRPADPGIDRRLAELRKKQRIAGEAVRLGEIEQRRLVRQAAPALLAEAKAWHRQVVTEAARLLVGLDVLVGMERELLGELDMAGLPSSCIPGELAQCQGTQWLVERMLNDGVLTGGEDWLPDHLRPERPGVAAAASSMVGSAIDAVRRAVGGKAPARQPKPTDMGGHELWQ